MAVADWSLPSLASAYADFEDELKARDVDAGTLCVGGHPTNPVTGMIAFKRATNLFEEYDGSSWNTKLLAIAGGGTGAGTASAARTNLGLGTMAIQDASGVTIIGGSITGLGTLSANAGMTLGAGITAGSGVVGIVDSSGRVPALSTTYLASLSGANLTNLNGSNISSGTVAPARLGTGSGGSTKFLREDGSWQSVALIKSVQQVQVNLNGFTTAQNVTISALTDYHKASISFVGIINAGTVSAFSAQLVGNTTLQIANGTNVTSVNGTFFITEYDF